MPLVKHCFSEKWVNHFQLLPLSWKMILGHAQIAYTIHANNNNVFQYSMQVEHIYLNGISPAELTVDRLVVIGLRQEEDSR